MILKSLNNDSLRRRLQENIKTLGSFKNSESASGCMLEEETTGLIFEAILMVNSLEKMETRKKKLKVFLKFLDSGCRVQLRRKSLIVTLERLLSFYRSNDRLRYAARILRSISARYVATRPERESHI